MLLSGTVQGAGRQKPEGKALPPDRTAPLDTNPTDALRDSKQTTQTTVAGDCQPALSWIAREVIGIVLYLDGFVRPTANKKHPGGSQGETP